MSRCGQKRGNATVLRYGGICVTQNDLQCLNSREYINDNIINFWLKYMFDTLLDNSQQKRIHICDTHFILGLRENEDPNHFQRRMKDFQKDFVIIPVNVDNHWLLGTWEYSGHVFNEQMFNELIFRSRLRFYDSMGKDYLPDEKIEIKNKLIAVIRKAIHLGKVDEAIADNPQIAVCHERVKKQPNLYDCGIHLLLNAEWFMLAAFDMDYDNIKPNEHVVLLKTSEAKRVDIKKLILTLSDTQMDVEAQETIDLS